MITSIKLLKPKAILFDWDNTLADTWPVIHKALGETFVAMGRDPWTIEETKRYVHKSMRDSFPELFGKDWEKAADIYYKSFLESHLTNLATLPYALEMLEETIKTGVYTAVVSNKTGKHLRAEVSSLGWDKFFRKIVGATDAESDKPTAAPVLLAMKDSGITPSHDVWFIGDTVIDIECAINSGCRPIFFGEHALPEEYKFDPKDLSPIIHVRNHHALAAMIKDFQ